MGSWKMRTGRWEVMTGRVTSILIQFSYRSLRRKYKICSRNSKHSWWLVDEKTIWLVSHFSFSQYSTYALTWANLIKRVFFFILKGKSIFSFLSYFSIQEAISGTDGCEPWWTGGQPLRFLFPNLWESWPGTDLGEWGTWLLLRCNQF